jgi:hypothetical protein
LVPQIHQLIEQTARSISHSDDAVQFFHALDRIGAAGVSLTNLHGVASLLEASASNRHKPVPLAQELVYHLTRPDLDASRFEILLPALAKTAKRQNPKEPLTTLRILPKSVTSQSAHRTEMVNRILMENYRRLLEMPALSNEMKVDPTGTLVHLSEIAHDPAFKLTIDDVSLLNEYAHMIARTYHDPAPLMRTLHLGLSTRHLVRGDLPGVLGRYFSDLRSKPRPEDLQTAYPAAVDHLHTLRQTQPKTTFDQALRDLRSRSDRYR